MRVAYVALAAAAAFLAILAVSRRLGRNLPARAVSALAVLSLGAALLIILLTGGGQPRCDSFCTEPLTAPRDQAAARAVLATLHAPRGFERVHPPCDWPGPLTICFISRRSVPVTPAEMRRLMVQSTPGATILHDGAVVCLPPPTPHPPKTCESGADVGNIGLLYPIRSNVSDGTHLTVVAASVEITP